MALKRIPQQFCFLSLGFYLMTIIINNSLSLVQSSETADFWKIPSQSHQSPKEVNDTNANESETQANLPTQEQHITPEDSTYSKGTTTENSSTDIQQSMSSTGTTKEPGNATIQTTNVLESSSAKIPTETTFKVNTASEKESIFTSTNNINSDTVSEFCSKKVGLEEGMGILTASDFSPGYLPDYARLNSKTGWVGGLSLVHYLQVDLTKIWNISGILLQTHAQWPKNFIQEFQLLYSDDGMHWNKLRTEMDNHGRFKTNYINSTISKHVFKSPVKARYVIINPTRWDGKLGPALRMELLGCQIDNPLIEPIIPREVTGDIMIDTVWEPGNPYLVKNMIRVKTDVTFILKPGVEIYFDNKFAGFIIDGILISEGSMEQPILLQSKELLSLLIARPFWKGIAFFYGGTNKKSKISYTKISSAEAGVLAVANAVELENVFFENCDCGLRLETGIQLVSNVIQHSTFTGNNHGIQLYNVSGTIKLSNLSFYDHKVTAISGNVHDKYPLTTFLQLTITDVRIENVSYGIYLTSSKGMDMVLQNLDIRDCDYGVYLELSDAAMSINSSIKDSVFTEIKLYGVLIYFKHLARYNPYLTIGNFRNIISNCLFSSSTNGFNYFGPEAFRNYGSVLEVDSCTFQSLQVGLTMQLYEHSLFKVIHSKFSNISVKSLDVTYNALDITGEVRNNSISKNSAYLQNNETQINPSKGSLITIVANGDSVMHGTLSLIGNDIRDNSYYCSLTTSISGLSMFSNLFDNPQSTYELCINYLWIPGMNVVNASYNWWGFPNLIYASKKIYDFYYDLDLGIVNLAPILREPRVLGSSWDNASRVLHSEDDIVNGGYVQGNTTISITKGLIISSSIHIPKGATLYLNGVDAVQFEKNTGILVEGELYIEGIEEQFSLISEGNATWKGIKIMHSKSTLLKNVTIDNSRGLLYIGTNPYLQSVKITNSYENGITAVLIQPSSLLIDNSEFENNTKYGIHLDIQGNSSSILNLSIANCRFTKNSLNGFLVGAQNIVSKIMIKNNIFQNNGFATILTDGEIEVNENNFTNSMADEENTADMVNVQFTGYCTNIPFPARSLHISKNIFHENSNSSVISGIKVKTTCINTASLWSLENNTFINNRPVKSVNQSFLTFDMPDNLDPWPLNLVISKNLFSCNEKSMSALTLYVNHGETIWVNENEIESCFNPLQVHGKNFHHNLTIAQNIMRNNGPIILEGPAIEGVPSSFLNFSFNELIDNEGFAAIQTSGYDAKMHFNFIENINAEHDLMVGDLHPVNATYNWWGTPDFNEILAKVIDGRTDFHRAEVTLFPCLLSRNFSNVSTAYPDVFQIMDNIIGGSVQGNVTLPFSDKPYEVKYPIRVPSGSSLTIEGGNTLLFHNNTGIYAIGDMHLNGNNTAWINFSPLNSSTSWKGVTIGLPRKEFMKVRLSGSDSSYTGRVEVLISGTWVDVCSEYFGMTEGHVVCKELGFNEVDDVSSVNSMQNHYGMANVKCMGLEMSLWDCKSNSGLNTLCNDNRAATVTCKNSNSGSRKKRATDYIEPAHTFLEYLKISEADVGLQINDDRGIELENINVLHTKGPGMILNSMSMADISLNTCIIRGGGDIGIDIQGTRNVLLQSCNITENFLTALIVSMEESNSTILISHSDIHGNGGDGVLLSTYPNGNVNISHSEIKQNGQSGGLIQSGSISILKSLVEDHPKEGANLHIFQKLYISNSAFSSNGGTNVNITVTAIDSSVPELIFENSAVISSFNQMSNSLHQFAIYTSISSDYANVTIPITFSGCQILDINSDAVMISAPYQVLSLTVTDSIFEHINGIAMHLISFISPQLNFKDNQISGIQNNFLVIDTTT